MIQRVQTIYLLLITLIAGLLIANNPAFIDIKGYGVWTDSEPGEISLRFNTAIWKVSNVIVTTDTLSLVTYTLGIICALAIAGIFMFKNRKLQTLLTAFNYIFILVLYILMVYNGIKYSGAVNQEVDIDIAIGLFFPLFLPVFNFMALRRINYDEMLVRSTDRLR